MDIDVIFNSIGQFGLWQRCVFGLAGLCAAGEAMVTLMFTFVGYLPEYRCFIPSCDHDR